ncbi:hypothetical protein V8J36_04480 [Frigidibacter sp. MR17.14]|uniref:hypothetical protein n=1 Tax=Frigidibacter sp. MR17.14 TaxID=3126509 RepID=UPI003012DC73
MKPFQTAAVFGSLAFATAVATAIFTVPAESYAPYRPTEAPMPFRADPMESAQLDGAPVRPTLDSLEVMNMVTRTGDAQAYDEPYCDLRVTVTEKLTNEFEEARIGQPEVVDGIYVELWASDSFKTWSALATRPDGISCVVETGRDWAGETSLAALKAKADA